MGLVYLPIGMGSPDFYGVNRTPETDRFSSAVVALDADTGEVRWVYQMIHHDLWDYDNAAQPVLVDFPTANGPVPALIEATKTGQIFVLDRRTGKPLTKVEERRGAVVHHSGRTLGAHPAFLHRHAQFCRTQSDRSRHVGHHAL